MRICARETAPSLSFPRRGERACCRKPRRPFSPTLVRNTSGLELSQIGMAAADLLADKLLAHGDPDEDEVRRAAPPMDSAERSGRGYRSRWNTIVGTRECSDTMPVYPAGNTGTCHPGQYSPELTMERARKRYEGLVGAWMPAVREVLPGWKPYFSNSASSTPQEYADLLSWQRWVESCRTKREPSLYANWYLSYELVSSPAQSELF